MSTLSRTFGVLLLGSLSLFNPLQAEPKSNAPAIRVVRDKAEKPIAFEVSGLTADDLAKTAKLADAHDQFGKLFAIHVIDRAADASQPALAGAYSVSESTLRFTPRFPLVAGMSYRAELRPKTAAGPIKLEFSYPAERPAEPTEVVHVYPSTSTLPENNLRFYIHFSESMGRGAAYEHLSLVDAKGKEIELPFLELGEELWDPRARRLTLLIDPGRIKKGVRPREEFGPVLETGHEYSLVIARAWRDAAGRPLKAEFKKTFRAGPPVEAAIDPKQWKVTEPAAGSADPLVVRFPASLDRALLERTITVARLEGSAVAGRVTVADEERRWEFRPLAPWKGGRHQLIVDTALEDLAGNRIGKPFEVDEFNEVEKTIEIESVRIPFEVP